SPYTYGKSDVNPSIAVNVQAAAKKSNVALARDELSKALAHLDAAIKNGRGAPVKNARAQIAKALATLPKS
ncbi:MAG: hypothetical protein FWG11_08695, partial [Promicromonosporaceae bacterium]|nr:hypothetical protein [Promicromonosporaceae bacterium]